ncbi:MAG: glutamate synthase subunit beta [Solirubrobacteraceae bacterium]
MGDPNGFLKIHRVAMPERDPRERVHDHAEIFGVLPTEELKAQGGRCMDCGVPFCHDGCPLGNLIPDWNDLVYRGRWREAIDQLHATNNFPEFTGLICPAPCESACVLAINDDPVMIKQLEYAIVHRAWDEGWIQPVLPETRTGRRVAVVGSGPAGLAVAQQLNHAGHSVVVFERDEGTGGLLRFGVPDAKLEKWMIDRRVDVIEREGVEIRCNLDVGGDVSVEDLRRDFDAVVLATGSRVPRGVTIDGHDLAGVHPAMDYLYQRNRAVARSEGRPALDVAPEDVISAAGRHVVVIGGGDTGMDCVSSANREGAASVVMYDVYPQVPAGGRYPDAPWPEHQRRSSSTYALDEPGPERHFAHEVTRVTGDGARVVAVEVRQVTGTSSRDLRPVPGSEISAPADLVLVAIGFTHPEHEGLVAELGVDLDARGNVKAGTFATSVDGVFACGDARRGQSLVVTAIAEGRRCARAVERWLASSSARTPA